MILYGNGGHAKVLKDCLKNLEETFDGFFEDAKHIEYNKHFLGEYNEKTKSQALLIIAIGNNLIRKNITEKVKHGFGKIIHPTAYVSESVIIETGTVILSMAVIHPDAYIGRHCIINTSSIVEHDCQLENFVHIAPNATLCGGVRVGEGTLIGASATILPNISIGKWCIIGAGEVVKKDIPDNTIVKS
jgi:sugar O-acyltransferase (sialic acid O-acetyltransferase NeuD family)